MNEGERQQGRGALHSMMEELLQYTTLTCRPATLHSLLNELH